METNVESVSVAPVEVTTQVEVTTPVEVTAPVVAETKEEAKKVEPNEYGFEEISDDDLLGTAKVDEPKVETKTESKVESKEEVKETPKVEEKKPTAPPKDYVPKAALHEARGEIKFLKAALQEAKEELAAKAVTVEKTGFEDFVVLSKEEFRNLAADDPTEALMYRDRLDDYRTFQAEQAAIADQAKKKQSQTAIYEQEQVQNNVDLMAELVPGIFDDKQPVREKLTQFAIDHGFGEDMFYLTNPATKVILPGGKEPQLLGRHAAELMKTLFTVMSSSGEKVDVESIKAQVRKEIEAEVTSTLTKKFVNQKSGRVTLDDIPDSGRKADDFSGKVLSEKDFSKLTKAQQDAYLFD